ncbi:MAG: hypothetical protein KF861_20050, partial [Planctomycetaceae bacterium]|nr:hypothetical protein [Planctomycetaceae bacterium]
MPRRVHKPSSRHHKATNRGRSNLVVRGVVEEEHDRPEVCLGLSAVAGLHLDRKKATVAGAIVNRPRERPGAAACGLVPR